MSTEENEKKESVWTEWWQALRKDRAGRAELRRCGTVAEAAFCEPFHSLRSRMRNPTNDLKLKRLGLVAVVLAHVDDDVSGEKNLAKMMAKPDGDKAIVSDVRFRQILRCDDQDLDELLRDLVRVIRQLNGAAPVEQLGWDLWKWNDDQTRREWALHYYERAPLERKSRHND